MAIYRPILRSKAGEIDALSQLSKPSSQKVEPIFALVPSPSQTFAARLIDAWKGRTAFVHGGYHYESSGSAEYSRQVLSELGDGGVKIAPAFTIKDDPEYLRATIPFVNAYTDRSALIVTPNEIQDAERWISDHGIPKGSVDIVIDLGCVQPEHASLLESTIPVLLREHMGYRPAWRSITISGYSSPFDMGGFPRGKSTIDRLEWRIWNAILPRLDWTPDYSDRGPASAQLEDPPGEAMARATVSVRYALPDSWIILKGHPTSGESGVLMSTQYLDHAKTLSSDPDFNKLPYCWADEQIRLIAEEEQKTGNRTTWAAIMINRHLELVGNTIP
ncbi:beta family protein [Halorhodospira sp. 9622]|uniref:beta family protein n=1 Tax=Halorhodospira sp. 9622 TaxID=2899136 RepID=UPI001EE79FD0|nr:beta family protein [Halorhodospira sp. 9622]MCG5538981.1 beta family protein [Halorhodospira sp. 9622]